MHYKIYTIRYKLYPIPYTLYTIHQTLLAHGLSVGNWVIVPLCGVIHGQSVVCGVKCVL